MTDLSSLVVLKKLSVNNIHIEPKQVKANYCIEKFSGEKNNIEFIYSYEHKYFNKQDPSDVNLASMMLIQVALNYGLFFECIEFDGLYDSVDKKFINDMMENTSREILTNKLLIRNEFLKPPYNELQIKKQSRYTRAKIIFSNTCFKNMLVPSEPEETDFNKYAILSSGGKDSLLSYGIIREIADPYPIFINESGRHWFTAVNAYRHFRDSEANTEKPWCNSDRIFNWVLKHLSFIKENYASIRSDIYPIRLWTVAVFIFGVLPSVRKRRIGNILVGDEYDTTVCGTRQGIKHYHGLYDQSKYFDNALTRYYRKKGWKINQFSLLRSLSELLIMKILVERYPKLQKQQVSCHSAHEVNGRMYPCGKCEKCRRIIGMIAALDADARNCGYSQDQIKNGLLALENRPVKQIGSDAAHLYYLLKEKQLIADNPFTSKLARKHDEITMLRFDAVRSNFEDMPGYIRQALFHIFSQYADGSVLRVNNRWNRFDLKKTFIEEKKYLYDER